MTGRPLDLTQRQVRALCAGAKKEGFVPVLRVGNVEVRLIPEEHAIPAGKPAPVDQRKVIPL